jgi:hypothetical protein
MKSSLITPDWSRVTLKDVRRACQMYDSGIARAKRPARSTFLHFNGKTYPAKFIRGLAYRLATGVELDPNVDYSGGMETARFFQGLGLATQHSSASTPAAPAVIAKAAPPSPAQSVPPPQVTIIVRPAAPPGEEPPSTAVRSRWSSRMVTKRIHRSVAHKPLTS